MPVLLLFGRCLWAWIKIVFNFEPAAGQVRAWFWVFFKAVLVWKQSWFLSCLIAIWNKSSWKGPCGRKAPEILTPKTDCSRRENILTTIFEEQFELLLLAPSSSLLLIYRHIITRLIHHKKCSVFIITPGVTTAPAAGSTSASRFQLQLLEGCSWKDCSVYF